MNSSTLKDLKERATTIRDEVKQKANTAERVGSLLYDLVDKFGIELADENRAVLQYDSFDDFPVPGSDNSIYIDLATNRIYRWDSNSDEYVTVSSTTASGGVVTHCVVIDDAHTVSSIDELPEASADNLNSVYMVRDGESAYAQLYYSRMKIRASYPRKMIYTWDADCEHSVLCGDWLTEGWEYLTNDATGALTNTQPEETATYIDDNTGNFYVYNSQTNTFSQISNEEVIDSSATIYIDCNRSPLKTAAASALAGYKQEGTYNVIAIERSQTNCYTFTVERSLDYYRQYLVGRDGYYYRTNEPIDGTGDGSTWSVWKDCSYAFLTDLSNSDTQVEANTSNIATNTTNIATNTAAIAENTTAIAALDDKTLDKVISTTHAELLAMVEGGTLVAGQQYRITDFVTTVANDAEARSAGHAFDLIVVADDEKTLNAAARAIAHDGDTYFANADLSKWQVWYDIHNDTTRYQWADATSGKGVIYRLIDEWQNDCPYDFKNVQFKRYKVTHDTNYANLSPLDGYYLGTGGENYGLTTDTSDYVWCYTFDSVDGDVSVIAAGSDALSYASKRRMFNNVIAPYASIMTIDDATYVVRCLNNITLCTQLNVEQFQHSLPNTCSIGGQVFNVSIVDAIALTIGYDTQNIIAGQCFEMNDLGAGGAVMTFGNECRSNTFGNNCRSNTFGDNCRSNTFGDDCHSNTFEYYCRFNTFGDVCHSNTFGNSCDSNTFGYYCRSNTFGNSCYYNTFGDGCFSNTFGNNCRSNTFGSCCYYNTFGTRTASVKTTNDYMRYISVESGVQYVNITCSATTSSSAFAQNAVVHSGVVGTGSAYKTCTISATNTAYLTEFGEKVQGTIS